MTLPQPLLWFDCGGFPTDSSSCLLHLCSASFCHLLPSLLCCCFHTAMLKSAGVSIWSWIGGYLLDFSGIHNSLFLFSFIILPVAFTYQVLLSFCLFHSLPKPRDSVLTPTSGSQGLFMVLRSLLEMWTHFLRRWGSPFTVSFSGLSSGSFKLENLWLAEKKKRQRSDNWNWCGLAAQSWLPWSA